MAATYPPAGDAACSDAERREPQANRTVKNPETGKWSHLPASHINEGPCAGGACLWFSEGCFNGCANCTAAMPPGGNQIDQPPAGCKLLEPTCPRPPRAFNRP
jgi:hypothetical protein